MALYFPLKERENENFRHRIAAEDRNRRGRTTTMNNLVASSSPSRL